MLQRSQGRQAGGWEGAEGLRRPAGDGISRSPAPPPSNVTKEPAEGLAEKKRSPSPSDAGLRQAGGCREVARRWGVTMGVGGGGPKEGWSAYRPQRTIHKGPLKIPH